MSASDQPVSLRHVRRAVVALGVVVLGFIWIMQQHHDQRVYNERLRTEGAEHLNLGVVAAQNIRQIAARARALGSIYRVEMQTEDTASNELVRLLASDPVFNRISVYDHQGQLLFASAYAVLKQLPEQWLQQFVAQAAEEVIMPNVTPQSAASMTGPNWRLPFLVPLSGPGPEARIMLVELDVGYLLNLYRHIDLGQTGFIQLLDEHGREYLRADASGLIIEGAEVAPPPPSGESAGVYRSSSAQRTYHSAFQRVQQHDLTVVIHKELAEVLAPYQAGKSRQWLINIFVSIAIILCVLWMLRLLHHQQQALGNLQRSQREKQRLIESLEEAHERSSRAASTDHLSGLYNRRQFIDVAGSVLIKQRNKRRLMAILFIDLDRFKSINDTLGHRIGDLLLQAVAGRITRLLKTGDLAARFGGDEFVVLLAGDRTEQEIVNWVTELTQRLSALYQLEGSEVHTSPSVGIAICPRDAQDMDTLLRHADAAMYSAKRAGRGQYRFYDPSLNVVDVEEFRLEQGLRDALEQHQFVLHYQPQIALDSMGIAGYEALVRWKHPEFGLIYPDRFIPIAERSGFIISLGNEVIELACAQLAEWAAAGRTVRVSVNVSALQLSQSNFSDIVLDALQRHGLDPAQLELEITETAILEQQQIAINSLERLRDAGLCISLDDFGKGYAGFAHLSALPVNKLKIDRSLIAELSNSHDDSLIVSSTITLAKRLSLQVVAEGVETPEQVVYLRLAGCDIVQGYHFSRPLHVNQVDEFENLFHARSRACG